MKTNSYSRTRNSLCVPLLGLVAAIVVPGTSGCAATVADSAPAGPVQQVKVRVHPAVGDVIPVEVSDWKIPLPKDCSKDCSTKGAIFLAITDQGKAIPALSPEVAAEKAGGAGPLFAATGHSAIGMVAMDTLLPPLGGLGIGAAAGPFAPLVWLFTVPATTAEGLTAGTALAVSPQVRLDAVSYKGDGVPLWVSNYVFFPKAKYVQLVTRVRFLDPHKGECWIEIRQDWPLEMADPT